MTIHERLARVVSETVCWITLGHRWDNLTPALTQCRWCDKSRTLVQSKEK